MEVQTIDWQATSKIYNHFDRFVYEIEGVRRSSVYGEIKNLKTKAQNLIFFGDKREFRTITGI